MRAATTTRRGPAHRATRRPPGRLDSHKSWTDRGGPVTSHYTYDEAGWPTDVSDGASDSVQYGYNDDGDATSITYPNSSTVTRGYDDADQLTSVTDWNSNETQFGYDPDGDLHTISYPNGVTETDSYDHTDSLDEIADTTSSVALSDTTYDRDDNSQLTTATGSGADPEPTESYGYNTLSQLNSYTTGATTTSPAYDAAGNPTTLPDGTAQTFDNADELTTATTPASDTINYAYDERGDLTEADDTGASATQTYGYDQASRLDTYSDGTTSSSYTYNGDGLRAAKTVGSTSTAFTWDTQTGSVPLVLTAGSTSYVYGPGDLPIEQIASGGTASYLQHDQHGSTTLLTNSSGTVTGTYTYTPTGATASHTGATTDLLYDGQYQDTESGLYYLQARYYSPTTSQFLTRDPLEAETGEPYGYAADNPLNDDDSAGLGPCHWGVCLTFNPTAGLDALVNIGRGASFGLTDKIANALSSGASCTVAQNPTDQLIGNAATTIAGGELIDGLAAPEAVNPLDGTTYNQKVLDQMDEDIYHGFPSSIDTLPTAADASPVTGGDGVTRTLVRVPGSINGTAGNYEWLIEQDNTINHRFFNVR